MSSSRVCATRRFAGAAFVLLLAGAAPALAVDGVLEINQACALAGCFDGDSPGFPVQIAHDGSYRLTGNLDVDGVTVITISAPKAVTLDLNGFVISGTYVCPSSLGCVAGTGDGIYSDAPLTEITIRNGTITRVGGTGIRLATATSGTIEGVTVRFAGVHGIDGYMLIVRQSTVTSTQRDGIRGRFARIFDTRVWDVRVNSIYIQDGGQVWGVETSGGAVSLRLSALTGYANCRLHSPPVGGVNLGQNLCLLSGGYCS